MIGQTISHYKILSKLGEGGMGEVWKAEDLNLERQVALKFLASHLIADPEIHKRFQREAKAAASLSHPNICYVHEIDEVDGRAFLAMELVEGEGLEDRIEQGPLPLNEALDLARQAAEGLQAAHDKGIVHRDIKPGNIRITADGRAKILDFGLALLTEGSKLTKLDTRVGTVAYMSPEQAQGAEVDHRSDIWALGCLLYEMVSGQRPFKGQYDQALLYEIVGEEPEPLTGLRTAVPVELEFIANKCLEKQAVNRYQTAREVMVDLRNLEEKLKSGKSTILRSGAAAAGVSGVNSLDQSVARSAVSVDPGPRGQHRERLAWLIAAALGVGMLALAFVHFGEKPPEAPLRRFTLTPPVGIAASDRLTDVAISPNGRHIAFTGAGPDGKLWVQDLDQRQPRAIERSEGAAGPFWSPDSEFIGFAAASELRKVSRQGGLATVLCQMASSDFFGGSWSPDGELIAFASASVPNISSVPNITESHLWEAQSARWSPKT